ncbi:unnamed protein product [Brassica oleracea var. botrytis]|uniref:(rape) hypothetical protein n=2 Tax=Brassica napus TaxID=3708 RepID=A0A816JCM7_BRANA|nr:unnamed protein product [Brassica napus]
MKPHHHTPFDTVARYHYQQQQLISLSLHHAAIWIREGFAEIGRDPPEPKGTIDSLVFLTQKIGRRAGDMNLMVLLHIEDCPDKEPLRHGFYAGSTMATRITIPNFITKFICYILQ